MQDIEATHSELRGTVLARRFRVTSQRPERDGIVTLDGVDLDAGRPVLVLRIPTVALGESALTTLRNAVLILADTRSPHLVAPIHVDEQDGVVTVVRPVVRGVLLAERLREGTLGLRGALAAGLDMMLGLQSVHDAGLLHLAIEPASVKLDREGTGHAALTYLGVPRTVRLHTARQPALENALYSSPEEAGSIHRTVDERSDLYSAGCVLFEALCGHPPFVGATVGEILRAQLTAPLPAVRDLVEGAPPAVDELLARLLAPDPDERYQSAHEAAADLEQIIDGLDRGLEPRHLRLQELGARRALAEPAFVGRKLELAALDSKLTEARRGQGSLVVLDAESGGGKSKLLDEFARRASLEAAWVLRGVGRDAAAQTPYQVLDGVIAGIVSRSESDPLFAEHLRNELAPYASELAAALPVLAPLLVGAADAAGPGRRPLPARDALVALFDRLGSAERPVLVILDDCQWADEATIELLSAWRSARPGRRYALVLVGARSETLADGGRLGPILSADRITVPRLRASEVSELVASMAGELPPAVTSAIEQISGGSPFMAAEVLRGLVEGDVLRVDRGGWRLDDAQLTNAAPSVHATVLVGQRLEQLPSRVLEVLRAGATLGKQFTVEAAAELSGSSMADALAALAEARRRHVVWFDAVPGHWAFLHDRLREVLLERLPVERRRALHLHAAERLARHEPGAVFELAYHFDAADQPERALPFALKAAADAHRRHALEIAERYFRIAAKGASVDDPRASRAIAEGLGDIALLRGRYPDAERHFTRALETCSTQEDRAEIEGKLGELAFKRGDVTGATQRLERALRLLGQRVPRRRIGFFVAMVLELIVQVAHTLLPGRFLARRPLARGARDLLAARLLSELAHAYWFGAGRFPCGWSHLREMNLAERYPPTPELAQAYSEHAPAATMLPAYERGIAYAQRSLEIRRSMGDVWGEGQSLHFLGVVLYSSSRYEEALESCREAVAILERLGDQWEISTAKWHIAACLYRLGRLAEAAEAAQEIHATAVALGDVQAAGISLGFWAKATGGQLPEETVRAALAQRSGDVHTAAEVFQAAALRHLTAGEPDAAIKALEQAAQLVRGAGLRQEYVAPVSAWLVSALRVALERQSPLVPRRRRRALERRTRRAARRACREARKYRNNLPHALRERGLVAALAGRPRLARRMLDESLAVAESQGAQHELALTLIARGELDLAEGRVGAEEERERGERLLATQRAPLERGANETRTLSLIDRFGGVLEYGRAIATALTKETLFAAAHEAAVSMLRVPECSVFEVDGETLTAVAGEADSERMALCRRALSVGEPVVRFCGGASAAEPGACGLCAVVRVRGRVGAVLVATGDGELFGPDEEQLLAYLATLAGAALENAEGFAAVEGLSRSLERRVQERTAELQASKEETESTLSLLSATLESTADGILVVDTNSRVVLHNRKFAEMWRIPAEVLESRQGDRLARFVVDQLVDPAEFLTAIAQLERDPTVETQALLELKDGSVFERRSKPQLVGGETVGRVLSFRDITNQKRSERELEHLANHDGLTGLLNRRCFEQELETTIAQVRRYGGPAAVLILDLDNFKYVNDTLGHGAGDELIKSVARLLSQRLRGSDVIARMGGDEFAVLLRRSDAEAARAVAVELLSEIRHHAVTIGGQRVTMTASIGVALLEDGENDVSQLLADADLAMYEAKHGGRDGVSIYSAERAREARLESRFTWAERLRAALEDDLFVLFAQPIVEAGSSDPVGHEVLLRMPGDDGSLLMPSSFLPAAERLGLMLSIDRWVVSRAIRALARTQGSGYLSINLSGNSLGDDELPALIARELAASGVDPARLIFEVTETATIANMEQAQKFAAPCACSGASSRSTTSEPASAPSTTSSTCLWTC